MKFEINREECGHMETLELGNNCGSGEIDVKVFGAKFVECYRKLNNLGAEEATIVCPGPGPNGECQADVVFLGGMPIRKTEQ